jgi:hypothetical protein
MQVFENPNGGYIMTILDINEVLNVEKERA